jgi:purine-binding chemotaxis protein CheW
MSEAAHNSLPAEVPCVIFVLDGINFAIPISQIKEISLVDEISPMPQAQELFSGIIDLRGRLLPVIDLRHKLKRRKEFADLLDNKLTAASSPQTKTESIPNNDLLAPSGINILVIEMMIDNKPFNSGLLVDEVFEVFYVPISTIEPSPSLSESAGKNFVVGLFKHRDRVVMLLDCRLMFTSEDIGSVPDDLR